MDPNNVRPFPGANNPELQRRMQMMQQQQMLQQQMQQPQGPQENPYKHFNPLPENGQSMQVLRRMSTCKLPEMAAKLQGLVSKTQGLPDASEELINDVGKSIALTLRGDAYCAKQLSKRPVVKYADDPELNTENEAIRTLEKEVEELQIKVQGIMQEIHTRSEKMWTDTVKKYALNTDERLYMIGKENEGVYLVELNCAGCSGANDADALINSIIKRLMAAQ